MNIYYNFKYINTRTVNYYTYCEFFYKLDN